MLVKLIASKLPRRALEDEVEQNPFCGPVENSLRNSNRLICHNLFRRQFSSTITDHNWSQSTAIGDDKPITAGNSRTGQLLQFT